MKFIKKMYLTTIFLLSTQIISLPGLNLTFFQIALIISSIGSMVVLLLSKRKYIIRPNFTLAMIWLVSAIIAFLLSTNSEWAKSMLLLSLMIVMFLLFIPFIFERNDIIKLEKALIRSQYVTILFSMYTYYSFYYKGGLSSHIQLPFGMYINISNEFIMRAQASNQVRLALPFATPPVLSIVMAMCVIILLIDRDIFSNIIRYLLITLYSIILIFTGSRTGVIGLVVAALIFWVPDFFKRERANGFSIKNAFLILFAMISTTYILQSNSQYIMKFFSRFLITDILNHRHLLVPLEGILIWLSSIKNFTLGIGFGSSLYIQGMHTYLPAYFLNSYVTLVAERGLMGLYIVFELIRILVLGVKRRKKIENHQKAIYASLTVALVSSIFYEVLVSYFVVIILAIQYIYEYNFNGRINYRPKNGEKSNDR